MPKKAQPTDSTYLLKVLLYLLLGLIWLQYQGHNLLPLGGLVGLLFAHHEHFRLDRRLEYVVLVIAALLAAAGHGLYLNLTR